MTSSGQEDEWASVLETLNRALKQEGALSANLTEDSACLCGQTVMVEIPARESAKTVSTLRQLLLREIDKQVKALEDDGCT